MSIDTARRKWRKHFSPASLLKYLVGAALVFSLFALSGPIVHVKGIQSSGTWTLKEIRVFNTMDGNVATITSEHYDATGGAVEINISGNVLGGICPGGNEKLRFTWQFDRNVTQVSNGGAVSASMAAGQVSKSANCGVQIASRSLMVLVPSSGSSSPFSAAETRVLDGERFIGSNGVRVRAAEGDRNGVGSIGVNTHSFNPNNPYAYFEIAIGTPTKSDSMLKYAYLFQNSGGGGEVGGGGNFSVEYDTDRRGGDYTNYDLPGSRFESCRDACANDSRCRAYTYVKPWQGTSAHCWLKSSVPEPASGLTCCISGVRR
jgi:hypothetical protein